MKALLNFFVDLCLLRAAPQRLPASTVLFALALITNVLSGLMLAGKARASLSMAWLESLFDSGMMLVFLYAVLYLKKTPERFIQAGTALMGSMALLSLVAIPFMSLAVTPGDESSGSGVALMLLLLLILWSMVVLGHILRHALDTNLGQGVAMGVAYTLLSYLVMSSLFPVN